MKLSLYKKIEKEISLMPEGKIMTISDFSITNNKTISKNLQRIMDNGLIEKLFSGVFWKPSKKNVIDPMELAQTLARKNDWEIIPCGDTVLHIMGLLEIKPKIWTFVTDNKNKIYKFKDFCIVFKHTSNKFFNGMSYNTRLIVQTIKAYGKNKPLTPLKEVLMNYCTIEKNKLIEESKYVTKWIKDYIKII